jgi:mannosyltransferase
VRRWVLAGILIVAAALRAHALDAEPWADELETFTRCLESAPLALVTSYDSQNHHVLYSLLAKLSLAAIGPTTVALRLPAALFGIAGVAAVYALGRELASAREGLLAAALLAVSYHHVWFSQNARGYTALAFFATAMTLLLRRALATGRRRSWAAYGLVSALAAYTHVTMLLVVLAHALVAAQSLPRPTRAWLPRERGEGGTAVGGEERVLAGPLLGFALCAGLVLVLYAPILSPMAAISATQGRVNPVGEWTSLSWSFAELARGLVTAFAGDTRAICAALLGAAGLWRLGRRDLRTFELVALPPLLVAAGIAASGHHLWPRFLFFAIPFGAIALVSGAFALGEAWTALAPDAMLRGRNVGVGVAVLALAAAASGLPAAYGPKQRFREALDLVERERRAADRVAAVGRALPVFREFYDVDWTVVSSDDDLEALRTGAGRTWVVHSFPIAFREEFPRARAMLDASFELVGRFDGTVHDGTVLVWRSKPAEGRNDATADAR